MTFFLLLHHEKTAARQESAVFVWTAMQGNYISLTGVPFLRGADFLFAVLAVATVDSFALVALVVLAFAAPLLLAAAFGAFAGSAFAFAAVFLALAGAAFCLFRFFRWHVQSPPPLDVRRLHARCNRENFQHSL